MKTATDQIANKLLEIINQIQQGIVAHGADAVNLALQSVSADGMANLLPGFITLGLFITLGIVSLIFIKKYLEINKYNKSVSYVQEKDIEPYVAACILSGMFAFFSLFIALIILGTYWNWVELFNPKVYLAHEIIQRVMR